MGCCFWGSLVEAIYARFTGNVFEQTVYIGYRVSLSIRGILL
jgi:hypothetical protein